MPRKRKSKFGGAPTKLNADIQKKMVEAISLGATYEIACQYAGISYQTHRNWINAAEANPKSVYGAYAYALYCAVGKSSAKWLAVIEKGLNNGDTADAKWKLAKRHPEAFGTNVTQNIKMDSKVTIRAKDLKGLSPEQLSALAELEFADEE